MPKNNLISGLFNRLSRGYQDVVGIEIGGGEIISVRMKQKKGAWQLDQLGHEPLHHDELPASSLEKLSADNYSFYQEALKSLVKREKLSGSNVAIALPVSAAIIKVVTLPKMGQAELEAAIETRTLWENVVQLTDKIFEYSIYWDIVSRNDEAETFDILFVAAKFDDIEFYRSLLISAGLNPVSVTVSSFALANLLSLNESKQHSNDIVESKDVSVILEFGPVENYLMFLMGGIPSVNGIFVSDADKMMMYRLEEVDDDACQRMVDRMSMQIKQAVSTFSLKHANVTISDINVVSSIPRLDHVMKCLQHAMPDLTVQLLNPLLDVTQKNKLSLPQQLRTNPSVMAPVLGVGAQRLSLFDISEAGNSGSQKSVNVLPNRSKCVSTQRNKFYAAVALWAAAFFAISHAGISEVTRAITFETIKPIVMEFKRLTADKVTLTSAVKDLKEKKQKLDKTLKASEQIRSNQLYLYNVLNDINRSLPSGIWFESLSYKENTIELSGKASGDPAILEFIRKLSASKHIERAVLNKASLIGDKAPGLKSFELDIELNPLLILSSSEQAGL